ncbi:MAG: VWA domain-containing protein, partial [Clostridia bacterium]
MEKIIVYFIQLLRKGGIPVSLTEGEDALTGIGAFGVENKDTVYRVLKATMLKNEDQKDIFDLVWRICFGGEETFVFSVPEKECDGGHDGEPGTAGMNVTARRFYGLLRDRKGHEAAEAIDDLLRETELRELTAEELAEQLKISLGWFMTSYALKQNDDEEGQLLFTELERYLHIRCEKRVREERGEEGAEEQLRAADTAEKDFSALSEEQVKAMEKQIARLGKKLAGRYSYRLKPAKNGVPDMRRILTERARRGHLPSKIPMLNKVKNRPDLVVLCDISGSMGIYSSFCLQLVCAMERRFASTRSFLFIDNIVETTLDFQDGTVAEAVNAAMEKAYPKRTGRSKEQCTTTGVSDYGRALEAFRLKYPDAVTKTTTLLIVGDAKTNWFPPKPEELRDLRKQCSKLIWLNPEPKERWNTEDSMVKSYLPHC